MSEADFSVKDDGSIVLFTPVSELAKEWVRANLPEDCMTFGGAVVVEHTYAEDVLKGILEDNLTVG